MLICNYEIKKIGRNYPKIKIMCPSPPLLSPLECLYRLATEGDTKGLKRGVDVLLIFMLLYEPMAYECLKLYLKL
jgi:hypothetical protein